MSCARLLSQTESSIKWCAKRGRKDNPDLQGHQHLEQILQILERFHSWTVNFEVRTAVRHRLRSLMYSAATRLKAASWMLNGSPTLTITFTNRDDTSLTVAGIGLAC